MSSSHHDRPYGVGLAYRYVVHQNAMRHRESIDLLEIPTEDYIVRERNIRSDPDKRLLREALETFPSVAHGISLSIGSVEPLDRHYLDASRKLIDEHGIKVFSEHLAFHRMDENDLTIFLSMPWEEQSIAWLKQNYYAIRHAMGRPFALENVTYYFPVPHGSLDEADFLRRLTEETDCTLLLDVTNVFNNSHNHGYDAGDFLDRVPLDRVSQIHLAGGHMTEDGKWEDSHSSPVREPVWELFDEVIRRTRTEIVILERDSRFRPFEEVMVDINRGREIFYKHRPERPEEPRAFPLWGDELEVEAQPLAPEFEQLRAFQRSMMARISDAEFQAKYQSDPQVAAAEFGLTDPEWSRRLKDCHPGYLERLAETWVEITKQEIEVKERYEKNEWAGWAKQMTDAGEM